MWLIILGGFTLSAVPQQPNHTQAAENKRDANNSETSSTLNQLETSSILKLNLKFKKVKKRIKKQTIVTRIALGWVAIRTIRAPERLGKTVSRNCSQNFHGIWSPWGERPWLRLFIADFREIWPSRQTWKKKLNSWSASAYTDYNNANKSKVLVSIMQINYMN